MKENEKFLRDDDENRKQDPMVFYLISTGNFQELRLAIADGYVVNEYMLECLVRLCPEKIEEILSIEKLSYEMSLYRRLKQIWPQEKMEDFLIAHGYHGLITKNLISSEGLQRNQKWKDLADRNQVMLIPKDFRLQAAFESLCKAYDYKKTHSDVFDFFFKEAWRVDAYELFKSFIMQKNRFPFIPGLMDFSIKHNDFETALHIVKGSYERSMTSCERLQQKQDVLKILEAGGEQAIYDNGSFYDVLLEQNRTRCFVEAKNWYFLATAQHYDVIDWEAYHQQQLARQADIHCFLKYAKKAKQWQFLAKYKCRWDLFLRGQFVWWFRSFAK